MPNVVFVAPFFMEATLHFVDAVASLPGVRCGLIGQESEERLPPGLRAKLAGHYAVADALDPKQIADATRAMARHLGSVDRLVGSLEQLQVPLAEVREALRIPGMDAQTAHNFRDKARMKTVLRAHDVPCARHALCTVADEARAFVRAAGFPVVVKPPAGAGARSTFRLDTTEHLERWLAIDPPSPHAPALVEEFMTGDEHSFDSVVLDGSLAWHSISRYLPSPLDVLRNPWIQWAVLLPRDISGREFDGIRDAASTALSVLGLRSGLTHMEWFRRGDGRVAISEVAARPPGAQFTSLLSYAHDVDMYGVWARLVVHEEFEPPMRCWAVGAAYLRGQGSGRVRAIHGLDVLQRELGELVVEARLPQVGQAPGGSYEGEGHVIVRHHDTEVVEGALRRIVSVARVELGGDPT